MRLFFLLLAVLLNFIVVWALPVRGNNNMPVLSQEEDPASSTLPTKTSPLMRLLNYSSNRNNNNKNDNNYNNKKDGISYPIRRRKQDKIKRARKFSRQAETDELIDRLLHINRQGPD
jgi:hypothetical protein